MHNLPGNAIIRPILGLELENKLSSIPQEFENEFDDLEIKK